MFSGYYAVEAGLPAATEAIPALSARSHAALDQAWERITAPLPADHATTLLALARRQHYSLSRLATVLDLSGDIVEQLAGRQLDVTTIPRELLQRLAHILDQSIGVVRQALGLLERPSASALAEERAAYDLPSQAAGQLSPLSFRAAISASPHLSSAQKQLWQAVLEREGL